VRLLVGTGLRMVLSLALVAAVLAVPLLFTYRSRCHLSGGRVEAHWRFAAPGHQKRLPKCGRPEQGLHYLLRTIGLASTKSLAVSGRAPAPGAASFGGSAPARSQVRADTSTASSTLSMSAASEIAATRSGA
jgi:hypothetical protein